MGGMAKGLGLDLRPFKELSRKLLLSIDRSVLVDLPPEFFYEIHQLDEAILSLKSTVSDVGKTYNRINSLRNKQRDFKEKQKRRRRVVKKREKQGYTQEEKSTLETNLAKFKKDALQTTQFLRVVVDRMHALQGMALTACREAQLELIDNVALPMARLDAWVLDQLEADLNAGRINGSYGRQPSDSYLIPEKGQDGDYFLPVPSNLVGSPEAEDLQRLSDYLADWEFSDSRKFALQYAQERVLDRHLDFHGLNAMKDARKVAHRAQQANMSLEDYIVQEKIQLENALQRISSDADFESPIKTSIGRLRTQPRLHAR